MPKISIIIPTYNSEVYLSRCIDSIINQSFKDFEVIFVDGFSKDGTCDIINDYIKKDSRIKPIISEKCGPGLARNIGIKVSTGKYIMFIDSDDYIDANYLENYFNAIEKTDYDIVIGGQKRIKEKSIEKCFLRNNKYAKRTSTGPYCRIIKTDFLKKNNIYFADINIGEDTYFNYLIYNKTSKIGIVKDIGYNFFTCNTQSLTHVFSNLFQNRFFDYMNNMISIKASNIKNKEIMDYFIAYSAFLHLIVAGRYSTSKNFIKQYNKSILRLKEHNIKFSKLIYIYTFKPLGDPLFYRITVFLFLLIHKLHLVPVFSKLICNTKETPLSKGQYES